MQCPYNVPVRGNGGRGQGAPRPRFNKVNEIVIWCGNVTELGPKAEAFLTSERAAEAHAFLVCEAHLLADRARGAECRMAFHGWRMINGPSAQPEEAGGVERANGVEDQAPTEDARGRCGGGEVAMSLRAVADRERLPRRLCAPDGQMPRRHRRPGRNAREAKYRPRGG